ncbi:MAG: type II secretion system F family protein [Nanoarchaeota archaeon]|nr:type II secretion system F family protein [Nanoarchaeota archaeon]
MTLDAIKGNIKHMKEIIREAYVFTNQLDMIENFEMNSSVVVNTKEKKLLNDAVSSLINQLKIINNSIPDLVDRLDFFKKTSEDTKDTKKETPKLIQVKYSNVDKSERISLTITDKDKKNFLDNLSKSNLSINQLKKKYSIEKPIPTVGKPNLYAKLSNKIFRNLSNGFINKGYFSNLNRDLRKINSPFVLSTYVSIIFLTTFLSFFLSIILLITLLFFNLSLIMPFITPLPPDTSVLMRLVNFFWVIFLIPLSTAAFMYFYPSSESKSLGKRIDQELPFITIHMSAIATSGVEPLSIFKIIMKNEEYVNTNIEFRKLMNLINFHGKDLVTALKDASKSSPSNKLKELFEGLATAITSGGSLKDFLNKRADNLLFDYKLERERYTKTSETFMDMYISIVIAAPMILLMLFVIMGSTGTLSNFLGLTVDALNYLIILAIAVLNIGFLIFLKLKQPII